MSPLGIIAPRPQNKGGRVVKMTNNGPSHDSIGYNLNLVDEL